MVLHVVAVAVVTLTIFVRSPADKLHYIYVYTHEYIYSGVQCTRAGV